MKSMTGFGRAAFELVGAAYRIEVRTLNSRFLDLRMRLPWTDAEVESKATVLIRSRLARGRVELNVWEEGKGSCGGVQLNTAVAAQLAVALADLKKRLGCDDATAAQLLPRVSELLTCPSKDPVSGDIWDGFGEALTEAMDRLVAMRQREGQALRADLERHLGRLAELAEQIGDRVGDEPRQVQQRLTTRVAQLMGAGVEIDPNRIAQEAALLAEKADVSEELARLQSHRDQLCEMIRQEEPVGRSIEFMLQELNRELNTVASKTASTDATALVVEAKGCLEKMREQAQNVE